MIRELKDQTKELMLGGIWLCLVAALCAVVGTALHQPLLAVALGIWPLTRAVRILKRFGAWAMPPVAFFGFCLPGLMFSLQKPSYAELNWALASIVLGIIGGIFVSRLLAQEQAYRATGTDVLTGMLNQLGFERALEQELNRARRFGTTLAVAYLDGDRFKQLNDALGHAAGNEYLRDAAIVMRETVREYDLIARLGGDEFGILYPQCDVTGARAAVTRLQQQLALFAEKSPQNVTWTIGVVVSGGDQSATDLIHQADMKMLALKRTQRGTAHFTELGSAMVGGDDAAEKSDSSRTDTARDLNPIEQ